MTTVDNSNPKHIAQTSDTSMQGRASGQKTGEVATLSGMQAASYAAYALSDLATIFPITPASHMSEQIEAWSAAGKKNLMGQEVVVKEMQSEKGASGAMHGALSGGALASTFTASQGLMLMIPNMYKMSGEMLPGVLHITCRSLSAHALSIFGDHQDLMAIRATGVAMLGSASVQECMDLSLVAHLSAIDGSLPFVHFMDGFRTSDEIESIEVIGQDDMGTLVDWQKVKAFRDSAMDPLHPMIRGTAQNSDIYFQNREAPNRFYDALPDIVQANMDKVGKLTGRSYKLFDYVGAPDAERVIVTMGSSCDVVDETVRYLVGKGEKVGVVKVRLFRPFAPEKLMEAVPATTKVLCALDRTKEPGSQGEPLLQDVVMAVFGSGRTGIEVIGGRYGLSSKDFTPTMTKAVFDNMAKVAAGDADAKRRFTVGIDDDLTHTSLPEADYIDTLPAGMSQAVFYGFGSDGTVGASKQAARLLGQNAGKWVQEYSWFDSKKSGGLTISYMRLGDDPIHSPYLIKNADYLACHKDIYIHRNYPMLDDMREGGVFVLNSPWSLKEMEEIFPADFKRKLAQKKATFYNIDAAKVADAVGLGKRINMIMETAYLKLSGVMDFEKAIAALKEDVHSMYISKGQNVVDMNVKAIDMALEQLEEIKYPESWLHAKDPQGEGVDSAELREPDEPATPYDPQTKYVKEVLWPMENLKGNELPTSLMNPAGFTPCGGTAHEKRRVANEVPAWDPNACIHCFSCSFVCPHSAIRPYLATEDELNGKPDSFETVPMKGKQFEGFELRIQNYVEDCVGCGSCAFTCPAPGKALKMVPIADELQPQMENLLFAQDNISIKDELIPADTVRGTQLQQPLLEFPSACAGCGETPHVKLLTQLFGDRLIIANATGCSSIWGGYAPALPYTKNLKGHGPAWGNSLFEDNAEYGYGIMKAIKQRREKLVDLVEAAVAADDLAVADKDVLSAWLTGRDDADASLALGEAACDVVRPLAKGEPGSAEANLYQQIIDSSDMFQKKSVWAVGGDGWAFDIDYGGLDEVLASNENINVLVLDTEGYSNTGGEMSKATQLGSVSTFSLDGKDTPKKRLARMAMQYDYIYVAQVCFGADMQQIITAMREAEAYDGPSIVVALCPCISWGIKAGMGTAVGACRDAVKTGYWTLWRFNPELAKEGKDPLIIDSGTPEDEQALREYLMGQNRFASLAARKPQLSNTLQSELAKERATAREELERMVDVYKR